MTAETETPAVLSTDEIARRLAVTTHTVRDWITKGVTKRGRLVKLQAFPAGKNYRVTMEALDDFLEALAGGPVETPNKAEDRQRRGRETRAWLEARGVAPRGK